MDAEFQSLVDDIRAYHPKARVDQLLKAYGWMFELHLGQIRRSGEPYHVHPIAVARLVIQLRLDEDAVIAALLHDVIEDTAVSLEELTERFGEEVAALVDGVTKLDKLRFRTKEDRQAETLRKMIVATAKDVRVLLVKLCDRLHNMRTLRHMPRDRQKAIAAETLEIYAPLANRLGVHWLKSELEDVGLKYLKPDVYQDLKQHVASKRNERERLSRRYHAQLTKALQEKGIRGEVLGRSKHFYSIYAKMVHQRIPFSEVYDLMGLRVIVDSIDDCYNVLGIVHSIWTPVQGRFKDYIRLPKPNGYRSLHTAVLTGEELKLEAQIRTREMHDIAENGIAAHWNYKEGQIMRPQEVERVEALKNLLELQDDAPGPREFLSAIKMDLYDDTVFVQTPAGDVRALPRGATPVDFAFTIHSEVGFHCTGARVNDRQVPLDYALNDGDIVEITTSTSQKPNRDWLRFLKSPRARLKVRNYIKKTQTETAARVGAGRLEKEFERFKLNYNKAIKKGEVIQAARKLDIDTVETLLVAVGNGKLDAEEVVKQLLSPGEFETRKHPGRRAPDENISITGMLRRIGRKKVQSGIVIDEMDSLAILFARCCKPIHGDKVFGFMSRGRGMIVHQTQCKNAQRLRETEPERIIDVSWDRKITPQLPVTLELIWDRDRPGLLADIAKTLADEGINLTRVNFGRETMVKGKREVDNTIELLIDNLEHLKSLQRQLQRIPSIIDVRRRSG